MAKCNIQQNTLELNSQQLDQLLSLLAKIRGILAVSQSSIQQNGYLHDALWAASNLADEAFRILDIGITQQRQYNLKH